jgi:AcrR family transcriptional regulator
MSHNESMQTETVLRKAHSLFLTYGIKSVTMDDIAARCGISKRTLYTVFNREKLIKSVIERLLDKYRRTLEIYRRVSGKPEEKLQTLLRMVKRNCEDFSAGFIHDLKIHYPSLWQLVDVFKNDILGKTIEENVGEGIRGGYYRQDINRRVVADLYIYLIEGVLERKLGSRSKLSPVLLITEINNHFLSIIIM